MDEGADAYADTEIQGMIESHITNLVQNQEAQKTNLEEENLVQTEQAVSIFLFILSIFAYNLLTLLSTLL